LAFAPSVHPLVPTIWLGFTYSIAAASLWPSFPLIVEHATVGKSGLSGFMQFFLLSTKYSALYLTSERRL